MVARVPTGSSFGSSHRFFIARFFVMSLLAERVLPAKVPRRVRGAKRWPAQGPRGRPRNPRVRKVLEPIENLRVARHFRRYLAPLSPPALALTGSACDQAFIAGTADTLWVVAGGPTALFMQAPLTRAGGPLRPRLPVDTAVSAALRLPPSPAETKQWAAGEPVSALTEMTRRAIVTVDASASEPACIQLTHDTSLNAESCVLECPSRVPYPRWSP